MTSVPTDRGVNRSKVLTAKLLSQGYRYHKLRKAFSKFYRRHFDIVSKINSSNLTASAKSMERYLCYLYDQGSYRIEKTTDVDYMNNMNNISPWKSQV